MEEDLEEISAVGGGKELVPILGNHIYFYTDVSVKSSLEAVKAIKHLNKVIEASKMFTKKDPTYEDNDDEDTEDKVKSDSPIYFHINSNGGDYFSGMAIADAIRKSKVPVYTIGEGGIASMGSIIFLAGKKRFICENAYILIHEIRTFVAGTFSNLIDDYENSKLFMKNVIEYYKKNSKMTITQLKKLLKKDVWFDAKTSIKYGFAHKIV